MLNKPSPANYTITIDSDISGNTVQAVDNPCELVAILGAAGVGALFARIYDTRNAESDVSHRRTFIAANAGESTPFTPCQPMKFEKGVYIVFEQGGINQGGGEVCLVLNK